jgi:hypothetical protein
MGRAQNRSRTSLGAATRRRHVYVAPVTPSHERAILLERLGRRDGSASPIFPAQVAKVCAEFCWEGLQRPGVRRSQLESWQAVGLVERSSGQLPDGVEEAAVRVALTRLPDELIRDLNRPGQESLPAPERRAIAIAIRLVSEAVAAAIPAALYQAGPTLLRDIAAADKRVSAVLERLPAVPEFSEAEWADIVRDGSFRRFQSYDSAGQAFRSALLTALGGRVAAANYAAERSQAAFAR